MLFPQYPIPGVAVLVGTRPFHLPPPYTSPAVRSVPCIGTKIRFSGPRETGNPPWQFRESARLPSERACKEQRFPPGEGIETRADGEELVVPLSSVQGFTPVGAVVSKLKRRSSGSNMRAFARKDRPGDIFDG